MAFILLIVQDIRYALFGYHLNIPVAIFLFACIGASLIYLLIKDASQGLLVLIALAAYTEPFKHCLIPASFTEVRYAPSHPLGMSVLPGRDEPICLP